MRLPRIVRTSAFRLTLLYAIFFSISVLLLFVLMLWVGTGSIANQIDRTVSDEIEEVRSQAAGGGNESLVRVVSSYAHHAPRGVYYLLQDQSGKILSGNMPSIPPIIGVRSFHLPEPDSHLERNSYGIRGRGISVNDNLYLFIGVDNLELFEMRELITRSFVAGLLITFLIAIAGGIVMSASVLRHVEAISKTSREIIRGNLNQRIPVRGTDDEFDHLAISFNVMLERIEFLMEGLRQVSSDIAHDLRTPLSRLRQRLERARNRASSVEELHVALDVSIGDVDAILDTFAALLRIAQIEAHNSAVAFANIDLTEMLQSIGETYQTVAEERGQRLTLNIESLLSVRGDRELLPQLFSNLIENSIGHCPVNAVISISAALRDDKNIEVSVSDNGPGIPAVFREKVFQRFYRLESSRTAPGTGLGLSLVAAIATLHGAMIQLLDNNPGLHTKLLFPSSPAA